MLRRRYPRDKRGRPPLREIWRHPPLRARSRSRPAGRANPRDRRPLPQEQDGTRPHRHVRRVRRPSRCHHEGDPAPHPPSRGAGHAHGDLSRFRDGSGGSPGDSQPRLAAFGTRGHRWLHPSGGPRLPRTRDAARRRRPPHRRARWTPRHDPRGSREAARARRHGPRPRPPSGAAADRGPPPTGVPSRRRTRRAPTPPHDRRRRRRRGQSARTPRRSTDR